MKKRLFCLFISLILVFTGCGPDFPGIPEDENSSVSSVPEETTAPLIDDYLSNVQILEPPTRDYGESDSFYSLEKDLVVRILYPTDGSTLLETAVNNWISETVAEYLEESAGCGESGEVVELTAEYSSYFVNENFAGIKISGIYERPYLAHPVDIVKTFNLDLINKTLLSIDDVLAFGGKEKLTEMVVAETGADPEFVDKHLLDHWLMTNDGLEITLARGEYLPMSDGTKTVLFTYEELEGIFVFPEKKDEFFIDPEKPVIALTFDDGPSKHTARLLDVFAAHGGRATFFVVGNMISDNPDVVKRIVDENHELGGHSWNHRDLTKLTDEEIVDQLMNTRAKIYEASGKDSLIMRPPYGARDKRVAGVAAECGLSLITWCVDTRDWETKDADLVYEAIMAEAYDGAIILCHDLHKTTVDAMERAIPDLIAKGYQLVTVTELLTYQGGELVPGKVYSQG